jgi:hypothetical protein
LDDVVVLDEIKIFIEGTKDKINERIDIIKDHIMLFVTGIAFNLLADIILVIYVLVNHLNQTLPKTQFYSGISFPIQLLYLIFALVMPIIILFNEKYTLIQKCQNFIEKFQILENMGNIVSYLIGYFTITVFVYCILAVFKVRIGIPLY